MLHHYSEDSATLQLCCAPLQVDSHTDFRQDWDVGLVQFLRRVPSYPRAVLSNYPRPGSPSDRSWPPLGAGETESPQGALCGGDMEPLPDSKVYTFRLKDRSHQRRAGMGSIPRPGCFVAAGFLFGPAAMLDAVRFDPYLPYIFHGEELSLSMRLWTSGFEIYSPPVDLVAHDYGRKSGSPKFWETVSGARTREMLTCSPSRRISAFKSRTRRR